MNFTIDYTTFIIEVERASLPLAQSSPTEIRTFEVGLFHELLRDTEDNAVHMPFLDTHNWVASKLIGGVTLAPIFEMLPPYTITFEDGLYVVNVIGANSNIGEFVNKNQVSVWISNSAGLTDRIQLIAALDTINQGVQKSSILVPHTDDLNLVDTRFIRNL